MGVTGAQLKKVIDLYPEPEQPKVNRTYTGESQRLDVPSYLAKYGIECAGVKQNGSSTMYLLDQCVFDPSHTSKESYIGQTDDGKLFYKCKHDSCSDRTWKEARELISGSENLFSNPVKHSLSKNLAPHLAETKREIANHIAQKAPVTTITEMVREFIKSGSGKFTANDVTTYVSACNREEKQRVYTELNTLKNSNKIARLDNSHGAWEVCEPEVEDMDLESTEADPVNIPLPLNISDMVRVFLGAVILIAGSSNAGKTAFLMWILDQLLSGGYPSVLFKKRTKRTAPANWSEKRIRYLNCEMSAGELKDRLNSFGTRSITEWTKQVSFKERHSQFHQLVLPDGLTFVDYLDVTQDFFEAGFLLSQIHERLDTGVAIVSMQKNPENKYAVGGSQTLAKPRLVINLDNNDPFGMIAKFIKVKHPVDDKAKLQGKEIDFQISNGCVFQPLSGWRFVNQKQRKTINAQYQHDLDSPDKTDNWEEF